METDYFQHPRRFPKNAGGPFYTTGHRCTSTTGGDLLNAWCGDCLWCGAPENEAPELLAPLNDNNSDTYFVRQPTMGEETEKACRAMVVCCVAALRYGGKDRAIIRRLKNNPEFCDYIVDYHGDLVLTLDSTGELLPFALKIARSLNPIRYGLRK